MFSKLKSFATDFLDGLGFNSPPSCSRGGRKELSGPFLGRLPGPGRQGKPGAGRQPGKGPGVGGGLPGGRSKFFPRLVLLSYSTQQPADRFVSGGLPPPGLFTRETYGAITGKQVLFSGLKNYHSTWAAQQRATEAQKHEVQRTADEVAFTVTEAFYRLIEAKENLEK